MISGELRQLVSPCAGLTVRGINHLSPDKEMGLFWHLLTFVLTIFGWLRIGFLLRAEQSTVIFTGPVNSDILFRKRPMVPYVPLRLSVIPRVNGSMLSEQDIILVRVQVLIPSYKE